MTQFLLFRTGGCDLALEMSDVREVVRSAALSAPVDTSAFVEGLLNLRGSVVPVLDMKLAAGIEQPAISDADFLIVIRPPGHPQFAIRSTGEVQLTSDAEQVDASDGQVLSGPVVAGLIRVGSRIATVLDPLAVSSSLRNRDTSPLHGGADA